MKIVIDFDGTCLTHSFPQIGKDIGAIPVLKKLVENGHDLVLWTMRGNEQTSVDVIDGKEKTVLQMALDWFERNQIPLIGINATPTQASWTDSGKPYGDILIDDRALGCPLRVDTSISEYPFVDWVLVDLMLKQQGVLKFKL